MGQTLHRLSRFQIEDQARGPGAELGWHTHDAPLLSLVVQGQYEERYHCCAFSPRAFDVVVKPGGERHADRVSEVGARSLLVSLTIRDDPEMKRFADSLSAPRWITDTATRRLTRRAALEWLTPDDVTGLALESVLLELVVRLARCKSVCDPPEWVKRAEERLRDTFPVAVSLGELGEECGVHPAHLARAFRRWKGCSVGDFVLSMRMDAAVQRLRETDEPLAQIALATGFYDQSHMGRVLRERLGTTPGRIRRKSSR